MVIRHYPAKGLTPQGWARLLDGSVPMVWLVSHDGTTVFDIEGGRAVADRRAPEGVFIEPGGLSDLVAPTRDISQRGASDDGVRFVDGFYDPAEPTIDVLCKGRDAAHLRRVVADLTAALDHRVQAELHFWTQEHGHWWAKVRRLKTSPVPTSPAARFTQRMKLILRVDSGAWRTASHVDSFRFAYETLSEPFSFTAGSLAANTLGANWPLNYSGATVSKDPGSSVADRRGYVSADGSKVVWNDDLAGLTETRQVVIGPYKGFSTATDNQVITVVTGSASEPAIPESGYNDVWGRMGRFPDGTWNGFGVRLRVGWGVAKLSWFDNFREVVMFSRPMLITPLLFGDTWQLVCGHGDDPRLFKAYRNGSLLFSHKELEVGQAAGNVQLSKIGPDYRGVGFGMQASAALVSQATPASVKKLTAGDNSQATQSGHLERVNCGDRPFYDTYLLFGPGTFKFWLGDTADYVTFGPLLENQVVRIDTDPRRHSVTDLTSVPPTPQQQTEWEKALSALLDFAGGRDPIVAAIKSQWGITPPQGNMGSLMKGRFSRAAAIPAKPVAGAPVPVSVRVSIEGGNAASRIVASGTSLRKYPL